VILVIHPDAQYQTKRQKCFSGFPSESKEALFPSTALSRRAFVGVLVSRLFLVAIRGCQCELDAG
jgi:hypothetical protein